MYARCERMSLTLIIFEENYKRKEMLDLRSEHATFCSIRVVLMYLRARKRNTNQMPKHNLMKYKWNILERMRKVPASES